MKEVREMQGRVRQPKTGTMDNAWVGGVGGSNMLQMFI